MIDLRSDTVTLPTPAMREAIARAEVGDDVYGEDPTVNRLEAMAADAMGKEAALLVASGTMGNLVAMLTHCARGTKAVLGARAHTYLYEAGGAAALGGVVMTPVRNTDDGELDPDELEAELATPADVHFAPHALVATENTHNRCGGAAVGLAHMAVVADAAHRRGLPVHLDGARIFNAALALETTAREIAGYADTISFCLSKGLACPVGSLLCGPRAFIERARRVRKLVGGGMRQAGIIAAAGVVALETMVERLAEDHANARMLAEGLARVAGVRVLPVRRRTNMVFFEVAGGAERARRFAAALKERGVLVGARGATEFRAVTHYGVSAADVAAAVAAAAMAAAATAAPASRE
ncbi:MAG TPA: low-specificity L-threonine aldolase [Candidatus Binataceae bacterium]|nr:low-specificity L-threonine aldolase [Candidatus Binataceae bacterium]